MSLPLENVIENPFGSSMHPYMEPFSPEPAIFLALFIIAIPTILVYMKTDGYGPALTVLILASAIIPGIVGNWGIYFALLAGIIFGVILFKLARGVRR